MSITYLENKKILTLKTRDTAHQMKIDELGHLIHLYYGRRIEGTMEHLCVPRDCGFSRRLASLSALMQKNSLHYTIYPFLVQDAMIGRMAEVADIDLRYVYCPHSFFFLCK